MVNKQKIDEDSVYKKLSLASDELIEKFMDTAFKVLQEDFKKAKEDRIKMFGEINS